MDPLYTNLVKEMSASLATKQMERHDQPKVILIFLHPFGPAEPEKAGPCMKQAVLKEVSKDFSHGNSFSQEMALQTLGLGYSEEVCRCGVSICQGKQTFYGRLGLRPAMNRNQLCSSEAENISLFLFIQF